MKLTGIVLTFDNEPVSESDMLALQASAPGEMVLHIHYTGCSEQEREDIKHRFVETFKAFGKVE